jgi:hypothetical protein
MICDQLLYTYQAASPGSRNFKTRLIEMIAIAVHRIAVILTKLDTSLHKDDGITDWEPSSSDTLFWTFFPDGPAPTLFKHPWYVDYDQYAEGVADMVGYWAEARILGGVVLFDRRAPDAAETDAVFFHSDRYKVTYRIYQLLEDQKKQLLDFLMSDTPTASPLPILAGEKNRKRVDPEEPIEVTGIYRDIWERRELPPDGPDERSRDVWDKLEYPSFQDFQDARGRCRDRRMRQG